jgi:S1-C subfamily serine protease
LALTNRSICIGETRFLRPETNAENRLQARNEAPSPRQEKDEEISSGSAFVVSRRGHLLTNNHVVSECSHVEIGGVGTAVVLSRDSGNDLALIQANLQEWSLVAPDKGEAIRAIKARHPHAAIRVDSEADAELLAKYDVRDGKIFVLVEAS